MVNAERGIITQSTKSGVLNFHCERRPIGEPLVSTPSQGLPDFMGRDKWCTTKITLYFKVSLNRLFAVEATFKCNPDEVHYKPLPYEGRI